jgi:hypothetical protein
VPATSPCRPWPYCSPFPPRDQLLAVAVGGAVVVVGVTILVLVFLVVVVVAQWGAGSCPSFCWHPSPFLLSLLVVPGEQSYLSERAKLRAGGAVDRERSNANVPTPRNNKGCCPTNKKSVNEGQRQWHCPQFYR